MIKGLPDKIKELRNTYNMSQKDVATRLNVSPSIISAYETGERTPSAESLLALSYLFKCSTDYLLGKNDDSMLIEIDTKNLSTKQISAIVSLIDAIKNPN